MSTIKNKVGRLSNAERKYIKENAATMSIEDMAAHLHRNPESVTTEIGRIGASPIKTQQDKEVRAILKIGLKQSSIWRQLKNELEPDEMEYFEDRYILLMAQFKDDVLATEENQVFKAIKYEIMLNRNASLQKKYNIDLREAEQEYSRLKESLKIKKSDGESQMKMSDLSFKIKEILELRNKMTLEYTKLDEKHQDLLEDLKATRKQRIEKYENSKTSFLDIIKMLDEKDAAEKEGRESLLMKNAMEKEFKRLGTPYVYADKLIDRPVLNSETVFIEEEVYEDKSSDEKSVEEGSEGKG